VDDRLSEELVAEVVREVAVITGMDILFEPAAGSMASISAAMV
jgi:hypothetical protein